MSQSIDISIISSGANLADARLHRLTRALLRAGLTVEIFAPGDAKDAPAAIIRKPLLGTSWSSTSLLARYYRSRIFVLRSHGRVIYAISPEAVAPTFALAKLLRKKFAVDFFEDYLRLLKDRAWARKYFGILGWIASSDTKSALWFAKRADLTTVADVQVPPFDARNRLVVRNLPDVSLLTQSGERSATPRAIYIGDLRKSRGLHMMLDVALLASNWEFDLVGGVATADQEFVDRWFAENPSATTRVRFHGRLAPAQSWKLARGAWVGLSLLESTPAFIEAVPSKLYEYMSVGVASISTPLPRCIEIIEASNSGAIAATTGEVAERLNHWKNHPEELDALRANGLKWASENLDSEQEYAKFAAEMVKLTR
jgi:glycosyltransferase involved in cell wall biosynthesis